MGDSGIRHAVQAGLTEHTHLDLQSLKSLHRHLKGVMILVENTIKMIESREILSKNR